MKTFLCALPLTALLLSGCASAPSIRYDYVPGTDFSSNHSFALHPRLSLSRPPGPGPSS